MRGRLRFGETKSTIYTKRFGTAINTKLISSKPSSNTRSSVRPHLQLLLDEIREADSLFATIIKGDYPRTHELYPCVEGHLEYLKFLKSAGNVKGALELSKIIMEMIDDE